VGQLHEVLAVLEQRRGAANKILEETRGVLANKHDHFDGMLKTYEPIEEDGAELPPESVPLTTTVGEKLAHLAQVLGQAWDVEYQVEATNQQATADVAVDGTPLLANVPATYLVQMDKRLAALRRVYDAIPTLDPKAEWIQADDKGKGVYQSSEEVRNRTEKKPIHKVVWAPEPSDEKRQPVIDKWNEDRVIGRYVTRRWSGMLTVEQKYELLSRLDALQRAVKQAVARANKAEHVKDRVAKTLFDYLHQGIALKR
jgi:hypothetical protein